MALISTESNIYTKLSTVVSVREGVMVPEMLLYANENIRIKEKASIDAYSAFMSSVENERVRLYSVNINTAIEEGVDVGTLPENEDALLAIISGNERIGFAYHAYNQFYYEICQLRSFMSSQDTILPVIPTLQVFSGLPSMDFYDMISDANPRNVIRMTAMLETLDMSVEYPLWVYYQKIKESGILGATLDA